MLSIILQGAPAASNPYLMPIMMVGMIAFFYLFIVRPQNKKKKELDNLLNNLKKGDKVISIGGIHGKVVTAKDNEVVVRVDANTELTFEKSAIARVVNPSTKVPNKDEKKNDKSITEETEKTEEKNSEEKN